MAIVACIQRASALALVAAAAGCVDFNIECTPNVSDPLGGAGWLGKTPTGTPVSTVKTDVRVGDHPIGQLLAESYYHAFDAVEPTKLARIGVENSGAIRSECRASLASGRIRRAWLRQILPFDNQLYVVPVTLGGSKPQLRRIFEHSVASFQKVGNPPNRSPPGSFLQVYGVQIEVDCNQQAEELNPDGTVKTEGQRIRRVHLMSRADPTKEDCVIDYTTSPAPPNACTSSEIWMAVNSYLYAGNDDYTAFREIANTKAQDERKGAAALATFRVAASYAQATYPDETRALPGAPASRHVFQNCVLK